LGHELDLKDILLRMFDKAVVSHVLAIILEIPLLLVNIGTGVCRFMKDVDMDRIEVMHGFWLE
jgi:hypothetical protein